MDAVAIRPFDSLAAMRADYGALSDQIGKDILAPANLERVREFIRRGAATGAILDGPKDRTTAQGLINFWVARLSAASRTADGPDASPPFEETLLADFDAATVKKVAEDAEAWFAGLSPENQASARRALMRMVVLPADAKAFALAPVSRASLDSFGTPEMIEAGLAKLVDKQILRLTPGDTPGTALVGLRYEALMHKWERMAGWLNQRLRFRQAVRFWEANAFAPAALIRDDLLDEAREYHDLDPLEQQFIAASGKRARHQDQHELKRTRWITGLAVVAGLAGIAAGIAAWKFSVERAAKDKARLQAESFRKKGVEALALAESGSTLVLIDLLTGNDVHLAKKLLIIQTLGQMVSATSDAAWKAARANWNAFEADLKKDRAQNSWFAKDFFPGKAKKGDPTTNAERIRLLLPSRRDSRNHRQELYWVSKFLVKYLEDATRTDPEVKRRWYGVVRFTVGNLAAAAEEGRTFEEVVAFEGLFWRLYLGEMLLVESKPVEDKMIRFGEHLAEWEKLGPQANAVPALVAELKAAAAELKAACDLESKPAPAGD